MPNTNEYEYNYQKHDDFYCYPESDILINKFDIRDKEALNTVERQITSLKIAQLEANPVEGDFDLKHIKSIHKFIFGDIYAWAGQVRKGDFLIKGDSIFCRSMYIENMAAEIHSNLKKDNFLHGLEKAEFINKLAYYMGEINALHPFREGNGRTQRLYFKQLCVKVGYDLEFHKAPKDTLIPADISAFNQEYSLLIEILDNIVSKNDSNY
jgi:cell filamentation protein